LQLPDLTEILVLGERITLNKLAGSSSRSHAKKGRQDMTELLDKFNAGEIIGLVAVGGGLLIPILCGVTAIVTDYLYKVRQLALKQDMLNRGMSAEDICLVMDAGRKRSRKEHRGENSCAAT
jgi:hypothetical protein